MSANQEAKKLVVEEIKGKIQKSKSIVLVDYKGITVVEDVKLRKNMREANVEYKVYKNTLVKKALNDLNITALDNDLNGTTSFAFSSDETSGAKIAVEFCKSLGERIKVKSGYIDGEYADTAKVKMLAAIPSRDVLVAQVAGALSGLISSLAVAVKAVAEKKEQANA